MNSNHVDESATSRQPRQYGGEADLNAADDGRQLTASQSAPYDGDGNPDERCIVNMLPLDDEGRRRFRQAAPHVRQIFTHVGTQTDDVTWNAALPEELRSYATAIIGNVAVEDARSCPRLEWLQTWSAGFEQYVVPGALREDIMITNANGAYGPSVSEHLFAMMWALMKRLPTYAVQQTQSRWHDAGRALSPRGGTAVIIGTGDIGSHFARLVRGVGMHTIGVRRHAETAAEGIDEMHGFDDLDMVLPRADIVAMMVPSTPETRHLLDARRFALLSPTAVILNAGRGDAIDTEALVDALNDDLIWGAGLDVTDPEPLPPDHPLWTQRRCLITPHVAGGNHLRQTVDAITEIAYENVRHYDAREPLINRQR